VTVKLVFDNIPGRIAATVVAIAEGVDRIAVSGMFARVATIGGRSIPHKISDEFGFCGGQTRAKKKIRWVRPPA